MTKVSFCDSVTAVTRIYIQVLLKKGCIHKRARARENIHSGNVRIFRVTAVTKDEEKPAKPLKSRALGCDKSCDRAVTAVTGCHR